jgi:hypothetical protein
MSLNPNPKESSAVSHKEHPSEPLKCPAPAPFKKARRPSPGFLDLIDLFVLLVVFFFLISFFSPDVMLSKTTTTGGDMGSHYALADYLTHYLIPHGKLIGWYPHWLAGMPMFQFYFIPPYLLMAILSPVISLEVAFKLVSVSGIFLLPLFTYLSMRLMGFKFPAPIIAACFSPLLLFLETYSQWGVNIKSTLAGQFPHGISFALAFLSLGLMYYGMKNKKYLALNAVVLSLVIMTHIYTPITVAATYAFFGIELLLLAFVYFVLDMIKASELFKVADLQTGLKKLIHRKYGELIYIFSAGILAMLLAGFWLIPLFAKLEYSSAPKDIFFGFPDFNQLFISSYAIFYVLAIVGVLSYLWVPILEIIFRRMPLNKSLSLLIRKWDQMSMLYYYTLTSFLFFLFSNHTHILYVRFLPILYFMPLMFAAVGLAIMTGFLRGKFLIPIIVVFFITFWINTGLSDTSEVSKLLSSVAPDIANIPGVDATGAFILSLSNPVPVIGPQVAAFIKDPVSYLNTSPYISHGLKDVPNWIKWNYEGLEKKPDYKTFKDVNDYFKTLSPMGRINVEYSAEYNSMGTPRLFEVSPVFSDRSVMEALLLESSVTFPYLYYLQKEVSEDSWWPGFALKMPKRNLTTGADDLRLYNVKTYAVVSDTVKKEIADNPRYTLLKTINQFQIYSLNNDSQYVEPVKKEPVLVVTDDWRKYSFDWMISEYKDVPLAFAESVGDYELSHFKIILLDKDIFLAQTQGLRVYKSDQLNEALAAAQPIGDCMVTMESFANEEFSAKTDCIGKPVMVKVSYFPNWMADGAGKMYLAAPSIMLAFPEKESLHFYYGATWSDYAGTIATILGILIVIYLVLLRVRSFRDSVHARVLEAYDGTGIPGRLKSATASAGKTYKDIKKSLWEKKYAIIGILLVAAGAYFAFTYVTESDACNASCKSQGYTYGQKSFTDNTVDSYHLGYAHDSDNKAHNFLCNGAICDESRKDQVYVASGNVEFDMEVVPDTENSLFLKLWDSVNCRSGDVYIDNKLFKKIRGEGTYGWHDFELKLPPELLKTNKIRVRLEYDSSECYGWDFSEAYVKVPSCRCYN